MLTEAKGAVIIIPRRHTNAKLGKGETEEEGVTFGHQVGAVLQLIGSTREYQFV